jgi:predicted transcriptional regulator
MPLKQQDKSQPVELSALVHPDTLRRVHEYAQAIDSDPDYVVNGIIADWFSKETPKVAAKIAAAGGR